MKKKKNEDEKKKIKKRLKKGICKIGGRWGAETILREGELGKN